MSDDTHPPADTVRKLADTLQDALALLGEAAYGASPTAPAEAESGPLLQQCLNLCEQQQQLLQPEPVRTLHHLACTGGTLLSKCIAAMPNVQLLSELDPLSRMQFAPDRPRFAPSDMVMQMRQSTRGVDERLLVELFRNEVRLVHAEASRLGQRLVLRDHPHSHFCTGPAIPERPDFRALLPEGLPLRSVVTVRHPLDSFAALVRNKWVQFLPASLDEYCRRYLEFLRHHADLPFLRYEDFVANPAEAMQQLCAWLDLPFSPDFVDLFGVFAMSGDSGRSGDQIGPRPHTGAALALQDEALDSAHYLELVRRLGYPARLDAPPPEGQG